MYNSVKQYWNSYMDMASGCPSNLNHIGMCEVSSLHALCFVDSVPLVLELIEQVLALHPGVRWFHIGGDEVLIADIKQLLIFGEVLCEPAH